MADTLNLSPDEKIAGVPLARLLRNLEETSYNEGALDLACRLSDCKVVIEALLSDRAATKAAAPAEDAREEVPNLEQIELTYAIAGKIAEFYPQETPRDMEKNHRLARAIQRLPDLREVVANVIARRASSAPAIPGTGREKAAPQPPIDEETREQLEKGRWCGDSGEPMNKWARAYDARFGLDAAPSHPLEAKAGEDA